MRPGQERMFQAVRLGGVISQDQEEEEEACREGNEFSSGYENDMRGFGEIQAGLVGFVSLALGKGSGPSMD